MPDKTAPPTGEPGRDETRIVSRDALEEARAATAPPGSAAPGAGGIELPDDFGMPEPATTPPPPPPTPAPVPSDATMFIPRPAPQGTIAPGVVLGHTYVIEKVLARGGMGEVYRARHQELGSIHAIKIILPDLANDPKIISLFTEEAKKLRRVRNDAVVAYEGLFRDETGRRYLVMEFVDGPSLATVLKERQLSVAEVRQLRDRLALGLQAAHEKGIYHRDISPDNIILVDGLAEHAKIIDFGIAKSADPADKTIVGQDFAGKYSWVSPEQLGLFGGKVDGRSDIYSLGLVLAAAGSGKSLDMGDSPMSVIEARRAVPDLSSVPAELRSELSYMLEPNPDERPQQMADLARIDPDAVRPSPAAAPPPTPARPAAGTAPPRPPEPPVVAPKGKSATPLIAAGVVAVLIAGGAGAYFALQKGDTAKPPEAPSLAAQVTPPAVTPPALTPTPPPPSTPSLTPQTPAVQAPTVQPPVVQSPVVPPPVVTGTQPEAPTQQASTASIPPPVRRDQIAAAVDAVLAKPGCADLSASVGGDGSVAVKGFVQSAQDLQRVKADLASAAPGAAVSDSIAVYGWPHCEVLKTIRTETAAFDTPGGPRIDVDHANKVYRKGDYLTMTVTPGQAYLYVDYLDSDGNVAHLFPADGKPAKVDPGRPVKIGSSKSSYKAGDLLLEIAAPFGPNLIVAIASSKPLPGGTGDAELAKPYIAALSRNLEALKAQGADVRLFGGYSMIDTVAR